MVVGDESNSLGQSGPVSRAITTVGEDNGENPQLPPYWQAIVSEDYGGRVYYANMDTGETSWERPALCSDGSITYLPLDDNFIAEPVSPTGGAETGRAKAKRKHKLGTLRSSAASLRDPNN